jgi:hypothetical protein
MTSDLYTGAGKAETEIRRITELYQSVAGIILESIGQKSGLVHIVTRDEVNMRDRRRLACGFGPRVSLERLYFTAGRTSFTVCGYEDDEREIFEIPAIRRFYATAFRLCPGLLTAADLRNDCLRAATFCLMKNLTIVRRADRHPQVRFDAEEMKRFLKKARKSQTAIHRLLGWPEDEIAKYWETLEDYFEIAGQ